MNAQIAGSTNDWLKTLGIAAVAIIGIFITINLIGVGRTTDGYSKTFEVEVSDFKEREICGLPKNGGMKFKIPRQVYVELASGQSSEVTSYIRINETVPHEEFSVDKKGCVTLHFSYVKEFRDRTNVLAQMVPITFYR